MSNLRPMYMSDLAHVIDIIDSYDDDDAQAAEVDYQESGLDNQYVLEFDDKVVGVTGYRMIEETEQTAWLSWTYLDKQYCGQGLGKKMVSEAIEKFTKSDGRKLFIKVSDYIDPEHGAIYEAALMLYKKLGFNVEVTNKDFYDDGENQLILGLDVSSNADENSDLTVEQENATIIFNGIHEIVETEGAYTFQWTVDEGFKLFKKKGVSSDDLLIGLKAVKAKGGRQVFLTFPSNLALMNHPLRVAGFTYIGRLTDYYEPGIDEIHYNHDLKSL